MLTGWFPYQPLREVLGNESQYPIELTIILVYGGAPIFYSSDCFIFYSWETALEGKGLKAIRVNGDYMPRNGITYDKSSNDRDLQQDRKI
jgi:hypothetical protein